VEDELTRWAGPVSPAFSTNGLYEPVDAHPDSKNYKIDDLVVRAGAVACLLSFLRVFLW
jgi:hypothetical protein